MPTRATTLTATAILTLVAACRPDAHVAGPAARADVLASAPFTQSASWSTPVNLGSTVNSAFVEFTPELAATELSLYFSSNRPGGSGSNDLWVSRRSAVDAPWEAPVNLGPAINSPGNDGAPHLSRDGHRLFFTSNRAGGLGDNDVWMSWRDDVHDDLAWEAPVNLGSGINGPGFEAGASLFGRELYYTSDGGADVPLDIYVSLVAEDGTFGPGVRVAELSSVGGDLRPSVSFNGLEIFLSSDRAGTTGGSQDIWRSYRLPGGAWSTPVSLGPAVNTGFQEQQPALSKDGRRLFFASNRPGGSGAMDIYVVERLVGPQ